MLDIGEIEQVTVGRDALPRVREEADFPVVADAQKRVSPGWAMRQISELGEIVTGSTPPRSCADNWNGDFPWISAQDFGQMYIERTHEHISDIGKGYCRCLPKGSVLITCIASIGLNAVAKVECATNQQINAVICRDDVYPEWLYYAMCFREKDFRDLAGQTAVPIINKAQFAGFTLIVPPLTEQKRIAEVLADADALIANTEKRIAKRKLIKQGMMQQLLTGTVRLGAGRDALPRVRDEEMFLSAADARERVPPGWKRIPFDECFEQHRNNTCSRALMAETGIVQNVHYGDILVNYGSVLNMDRAAVPYLTEEGVKCSPKDYLRNGDIVIADTAEDEIAGKVVEIQGVGERKVVSGLHTVFCRPKDADMFAPGWLGYWMNSSGYHDQLISMMTGIKVLSLSRGNFQKTSIAIPPLAEQQAIAAVLTDMDSEITVLEKKVKKYCQLKSGMMSELLTGKVRLSEGK